MSPCHEFIRNTRNTPVLPHHRLQSAGGAVCEASEGLNQSDEGEAGGALHPTSPLSLSVSRARARAHTHTTQLHSLRHYMQKGLLVIVNIFSSQVESKQLNPSLYSLGEIIKTSLADVELASPLCYY